MASKEQYVGNWFEGVVQDALKELQATKPCAWHRFTDSKAARSLVQSQPGDHMLVAGGLAILIEEKASMKYDNLRSGFSALFPKKQAAKHRIWHRAEAPSWIIFCDYDESNKNELDNCVEVWGGESLATSRALGVKIATNVEPIITCRASRLVESLWTCVEYEWEKFF